ncbi:MAG: penicillin-binding transpeptidase domain-containing protein [Desulfosalsimonas sp.]
MGSIFKKKPRRLIYAGNNSSAAWRRYQSRYRKKAAKRKTMARLPGYLAVLVAALLLIKGGFYLIDNFEAGGEKQQQDRKISELQHSDIKKLLDPADFANQENNVITKKIAGRNYAFRTTLEPELQKAAVSMLDPRWARHIAIVAMEPSTGRILAMASHDRNGSTENPCLSTDFPAASLFKIITAAAAIETCGFKPERKISFNGGKYTLYKHQLEDKQNSYTNHVSLDSAFAESVNPVFGKIGTDYLGKSMLEKYASAFGFNREIEFDLRLEKSSAPISDQSYNWAEVACGFNRETRISPLHGAMLAASVIEDGKIMKPRLIDTVKADGQTVYRQNSESMIRAVSPKTARTLKPLMHTSLTRGTARAGFSDPGGRRLMENLEIGGKTGSINYNPDQIRYDWFSGYASQEQTGRSIAVCVLVAHEKYIGKRAARYFREIVEQYFDNSIMTSGLQK